MASIKDQLIDIANSANQYVEDSHNLPTTLKLTVDERIKNAYLDGVTKGLQIVKSLTNSTKQLTLFENEQVNQQS